MANPILPPGTRRCSKCREAKAVAEFHKNRSHADGYSNQCRECFNAAARDRWSHAPPKVRPKYTDRTPKRCRSCQKTKPLRSFPPDGRATDGRQSRCRTCCRSANRRRYHDTKHLPGVREGLWRSHLKKAYGISPKEYAALYAAQGGRCAICDRGPNGKTLHLDHDHRTGAVRGFLCSACNQALGRFGDSVEGVRRVLRYLEVPPSTREGVCNPRRSESASSPAATPPTPTSAIG